MGLGAMFKWTNPKIEALEAQIETLSSSVEYLKGANAILAEELSKVQEREKELLDTIFRLTGVRRDAPTPSGVRTPLSTNRPSWPQRRQTLEQKAQEEYWTTKKESSANIAQLEEEVLNEDASQVG